MHVAASNAKTGPLFQTSLRQGARQQACRGRSRRATCGVRVCSLQRGSAPWRGGRPPSSCSNDRSSRLCRDDPRSARPKVGRKLGYFFLVVFGEIAIIPPIQKLVATNRINFKNVCRITADNGFPFEIDGDWQ